MMRGLMKLLLQIPLPLASLFAVAPASAQICLVTTVSPVFSSYSSSVAQGQGSIKVICTSAIIPRDVAFSVNLTTGNNASGNNRNMSSIGTSNLLKYNLRCASGLTSPSWIDGTGGTCHKTGGKDGLIGSLTTD